MAELLKNYYNETFIEELANAFKAADANFDIEGFSKAVFDKNWKNLELKERANHITVQIHAHLKYDYKAQIAIINKVAPQFSNFTALIFPNFVEQYGIDDFETSIPALKEYTKYSTSELAIRPFLVARPETIETMLEWSKDENYHIRRLASEGCRPLLPWAMKLHQYVADPSPILPILSNLRNDPEDYVYRSVANNLNDISKHHPDLVLEICKAWYPESDTTKWVCKHALRTLLKKGNQEAMKLFGFGSIKSIAIDQFEIKDQAIAIGKTTQLSISLQNKGKKAKFRLEYEIGYLKKNGSHSGKVFQLRETTLKEGETLTFTKKLDFKDLSTRKHYAGKHFAHLKVNGNPVKTLEFNLE